jgi:hypothetical protein
MRRVLRVLTGTLLGLVFALVVLLGLLAFQASVQEEYLHGWAELLSWSSLPLLLVPALLAWIAGRRAPARFWRSLGLLLGAAALGTAAGALGGSLYAPHPSAPWAGGLMGAAAAVLAGLVVVAVKALRVPKGGATLLLLGLTVAASCRPAPDPPPTEARSAPEPHPDSVASVVFLLGDPGMAVMDRYPVLQRMREDVERWSRAVGPDGDVAMLVLGDILYPLGLHTRSHEDYRWDSLRVATQIGVLEGPAADSAGARGFFLPGNHDWGRREDFAGSQRLVRLDRFLESWSGEAAGRVDLHPEPGTGGPSVVDLGSHLRLVLLDTAWWLLGREPGEKAAFLRGIREALATAGDRRVIMAAHHPMRTAGPHGLGVDLGSFLGIRLLLKNAGIILQDLDSRVYADLDTQLESIYREVGGPDVYAGGHDHSLQVFGPDEPGATRGVVVGSASKLSGLSDAPGLRFGRSEPGYGKIFILEDGSMRIRLEATHPRFLSCAEGEADACVQEALDSFRTVWSEAVPRSTRPEGAGELPVHGSRVPEPGGDSVP